MDWISAAEWWVPTIVVAALAATAVLATRRSWMIPVIIVSALAVIGTVRQQTASTALSPALARSCVT
jgi:hypothetical protein